MAEFGSTERERLQLAITAFKDYVASLIETGVVEVGNRTTDEILSDVGRRVASDIECPDVEFQAVVDHRDSLLDQASSAASKNHCDISIVLYATWIEHSVNSLLLLLLDRQGISLESIRKLIRELRLSTKLTALWEIAHLPPLQSTPIKLIDKVISLRNAFVHYKWPVAPDAERNHHRNSEISVVLSEIETIVQLFHELEDQALWSGRRDEILEALDEGIAQQEKEFGLPDLFSDHGPTAPS